MVFSSILNVPEKYPNVPENYHKCPWFQQLRVGSYGMALPGFGETLSNLSLDSAAQYLAMEHAPNLSGASAAAFDALAGVAKMSVERVVNAPANDDEGPS